MKNSKRILTLFFVIFLLLFIFRGQLYNNFVLYHSTGEREVYLIQNSELQHLINKEVKSSFDINKVIEFTNKFVAKQLTFSSTQTSNNPNLFFKTKKAHCVGYSQLYTSVFNYVLKKNNLDNEWKATTHIGKLTLFKQNIHSYIKSPFFKDHDFVIIQSITTQEKIATDPSLYDYLMIDKVTLKE